MKVCTELKRKPILIGKCSRGFLIPKNELRLNSSKTYIIKIIEEDHDPGIKLIIPGKGVKTNAHANNGIRTGTIEGRKERYAREIYKCSSSYIFNNRRIYRNAKTSNSLGD